MSDNYYRFFPGDYHRDTGDLSIIEHGAYRLLLDHYYMRGNLPSDRDRLYRLCRAFNGDEREAIERVVEIFFIDDGECLINKKAEEEIEKRNGYLDEQARKSRLGVEARRKLKEEPTGQPTGQPKGVPLPSPSPSPSPEENNNIVEKESRPANNIPYKAIVSYLNEKANTHFKHDTNETKRLIKARINQGFDLKAFEYVIDVKCQAWLTNPNMVNYLRPQTLFGTKFESYLNEVLHE